MKTKEEIDALKEEVETLRRKLAELSEEELEQVSGGTSYDFYYNLIIASQNSRNDNINDKRGLKM